MWYNESMRVPIRKGGKYTFSKPDPHLTAAKFDELKKNLEKLKASQMPAAAEMRRLAELGDLSENAGYQIAKGRLRGINQKILELEDHLNRAVTIKSGKNIETVGLGNIITVEINGAQKTFQILGSSETDPTQGIISHNSPIGSALMGCRVGERVEIKLKDKTVECKVIKIE